MKTNEEHYEQEKPWLKQGVLQFVAKGKGEEGMEGDGSVRDMVLIRAPVSSLINFKANFRC